MKNNKVDKHYVSDVDKFIEKFNAENPLSESQKAEIQKHEKVFELRDKPQAEKKVEDIWEGF